MNQRDCKKCVYYGGKRKGKVFWLCEVQRYDRRESNLCVDKVGVFNAEEAGVSFYQCVLRTDEVKH